MMGAGGALNWDWTIYQPSGVSGPLWRGGFQALLFASGWLRFDWRKRPAVPREGGEVAVALTFLLPLLPHPRRSGMDL